MLNNLVDNALRYIPAGARVDLALREQQGNAVLTVMDNGPDIPREEWASVFERFHRLAGAEVPGSGLGLAIVKQIVAQHHAEIALDDTPGGGLTVCIMPDWPTTRWRPPPHSGENRHGAYNFHPHGDCP